MQSVFCATGTSRWKRTQASVITKMQGKSARKFTFLSRCVSENINDSRGVKIKVNCSWEIRSGNYRFFYFHH